MHAHHLQIRRHVLQSLTIALAAGAGGLSGCATRAAGTEPEPQPPVIDSLMLLPVAIPSIVSVENKGMRGGMNLFLGFLGPIVAADTIRKNSARVSEELRTRGTDLAGRLRAGVLREIGSGPAALSEYGDAGLVAKAREADDFTLLKAEADALLDITVSEMGFYSSSGMDDYTPQVYVSMGLRSPATSEWLGDASYAYDRSPSKGYQRHFQTAAEFKFASVEALVADGARAARALEVAMDSIAGAIAVDVRTVLAGKFLA